LENVDMNICERCRKKLTVIGASATICLYCAGLALHHEAMPDAVHDLQVQGPPVDPGNDDDDPTSPPTDPHKPMAVAAVSGASTVPFGWNTNLTALPPQRRATVIDDSWMMSNAGWLAQRSATAPPSGWNVTAQDLPPRRRPTIIDDSWTTNAGWLVQHTKKG
jgi:hypothetical protein